MDNDLKEGMKNILKATEVKITESILRWKYRKEGKGIPGESELQHRSHVISQKANEILTRRGKSIMKEFKEVYRKEGKDEGGS
jgi:hypothetical protein